MMDGLIYLRMWIIFFFVENMRFWDLEYGFTIHLRQRSISSTKFNYRASFSNRNISTSNKLQLQELNNRFNEQTVGLLTLSSTLDPNENYKSFKFSRYCYTILVMSKIDGNRKVKNLPLDCSIDSPCFDSFGIYNNYKESFFNNENCQNKILR